MSYEMEDLQLDAEIRLLKLQIKQIKGKVGHNSKELAFYESKLKILEKRRNKPKVIRMLEDADMHHVSGRIWSMNDGCFLWMLIIWAFCFLLSILIIVSH